MLPRRPTPILVLLLAVAAMAGTRPVSAETSAGVSQVRQVESFNGPWRVHAGDDPLGASPTLDDSAWRQLELGSAESKYLAAAQGVLWFRARIPTQNLPADAALLIAPKATGCQVFVNGSKVSDCNQLPGPNYYVQRGMLIHLAQVLHGPPLLLAIRLDHPRKIKSAAVGLGQGDVIIGSTALLADHRTAEDAKRFYSRLPQSLLCLGELLAGAVLLLAFAFDRTSREYLWFAAFLWLDGPASLMSCFDDVYPVIGPGWQIWLNAFGMTARYAPLIGFLAAFTRTRVNWALRGYQILLLLAPEMIAYVILYGQPRYSPNWDYVLLALQLPFVVGSLVFLAMQWRRGNRDAALLLPSFLLANSIEILGLTGVIRNSFHFGSRFQYNWDDLSMFFFLISIAPVMIARHRRTTLEHARTSAELAAARVVQERLVPKQWPAIHGYHLEAAYLPATEVGGDFYQVIARPDGSVILLIGDVSGKGLKAAMFGTLLVGAAGVLAQEEIGPGRLLARLSDQVQGRFDGGFATCLCARITPAGQAAIANAGHLNPYCGGREIELPGGLPLGIVAGEEFEETKLTLAPGESLTFLSDGVPEARNASAELFGFERTRDLSRGTAQAIAETAQRFGQEDDITVLTLTRLHLLEESATQQEALAELA